MTVEKKARVIAFYLPQFHPIQENDAWWGPGFTEWTNVVRAKPLFSGHEQPIVPGELGFYDLRLPETRLAQAKLAADHGVEGFCYWHYWFGGRRVLERPFNEVLTTGEPDFPFCLGWANHSWKGKSWSGVKQRDADRLLIAQTYPGEADDRAHFAYLLDAFRDPRYMKVDGKPIFVIFRPTDMPDPKLRFELWRQLAREAGLDGLYIIGINALDYANPEALGLDAVIMSMLTAMHEDDLLARRLSRFAWRVRKKLFAGGPRIVEYRDAIQHLVTRLDRFSCEAYPCVYPNWDNTPRKGRGGLVLAHSTPDLFARHMRSAIEKMGSRPLEHKLVFVKSWNEWAEGNFLEPCARWGRGYLEALRDVVLNG